jgi:hypothetical protein
MARCAVALLSLAVGAAEAARVGRVIPVLRADAGWGLPRAPAGAGTSAAPAGTSAAPVGAPNVVWKRQSIPLSGEAVLTDVHVRLSSASPGSLFGFVSGELGVLLKLNASISDPSPAWARVTGVEDGSTYNYGVFAFADEATVLLSGFTDGGSDTRGYLRYSRDGGATWEAKQEQSALEWCGGPIYFGDDGDGTGPAAHGIVPSVAGAKVWVTASGGLNGSAWSEEQPDPAGAWHAGDYIVNGSLIKMAGASDCSSTDYGVQWQCVPPVDADADGGLACAGQHCVIGGGEISPSVAGWVHLSEDGGATWALRAFNAPFPIRTVEAVPWVTKPAGTPPLLVAAGGNYFSGVGGIFSSKDGGHTWTQDLDTQGSEVKACRGLRLPGAPATFRLFCVSGGPAAGAVFAADIAL